MMKFKGRVVTPGVVTAEALVSHGGLNTLERLPLLVRSGVTGRVNLTRGDSFVFDVVCRNGQDEQGLDVKGIMIVESVSAE